MQKRAFQLHIFTLEFYLDYHHLIATRRIVLNNRRLIVCDRDRDYANSLADYIRRSECGYEVVTYTDPEVFSKDLGDKDISLLLIQQEFLEETGLLFEGEDRIEDCGIKRIYVLVEDREYSDPAVKTIYKYQSARNVISIIGDDIETRHRISEETRLIQSVKLIGVYSPVNHTLKTTFAMTLGQILAEEMQVLYINLEGYSGLYEMLNIKTEGSMLDLMYEYSLNREDLFNIIFKYTVRMDELNILKPARSPFELQEVDPALWMTFLSDLTTSGRYGAIILDISDAVRGALDLMNVCSSIYTPLRKDSFSVAKLKDFTDMLKKCPGGDDLDSRMIKLRFPYFEDIDGSLSDLKHSRLSRYIRTEICGDKG